MPYTTIGRSRKDEFEMYFEIHNNETVIKEDKDGTTINDILNNGKENVVLVMGFLTPGTVWYRNLEEFTKDKEFNYLIFDNRGSGISGTPKNYSSKEMARDVEELLNYLKWDKVHLVGVSMGGMISLEFASEFPSRLLSLSLIVTHAGSLAPWKGIRTITRTLFIRDHYTRGNLLVDILYSSSYLLKQSNKEPNKTNRDVFLEKYVSDCLNNKPPTLLGVYGHIKTVNTHRVSKSRLLEIKSNSEKYSFPISIITGNSDDLVKSSNSFYLNEILQPSEFVVFDGSGHSVNIENYDEFHHSLRRLFKRSQLLRQPNQQQQQQQQQQQFNNNNNSNSNSNSNSNNNHHITVSISQ